MKWNTYIHMDEYNGLNQSEEWARINKENARKSQFDLNVEKLHIDKVHGFWYMNWSPDGGNSLEYYTKEDWLARHRALFQRMINTSIQRKGHAFQPYVMQYEMTPDHIPLDFCRPLGWMYPCEYARLRLCEEGTEEEKKDIYNRCKYCLLDWEGSKCKHPCQDQYEDGDGKGLYNRFLNFEEPDYVEGVALARRIMKLPLRKEND